VYAVRYAHPNSAFGGTSYTPRTLSEMLARRQNVPKYLKNKK